MHDLYIEQGTGPAVVFSHGTFMDRTMFDPQVAALSNSYRTIAYNSRVLAGPNVPHSLDDLADDCRDLLDRLQIATCVLVGMSVGGMMAMHFALRYQDRLDGLVLIDAFAYAFSPEEKTEFGERFGRLDRDGMVPREFAEWVAPLCFGETTQCDNPELLDHWVERWCSTIPARSVYHQALSWLDKPDLTRALSRIHVPTLILCGDEDVRMNMHHLDEMQANILDAQLVKIPRAGHTSNLENPVASNSAIKAFLDRVYTPLRT